MAGTGDRVDELLSTVHQLTDELSHARADLRRSEVENEHLRTELEHFARLGSHNRWHRRRPS